MRGPTTITIADADALDDLPDETLIRASGRYPTGGRFLRSWARPVPTYITGTEDRAWQVLIFGFGDDPTQIVPADHFDYPVTVLFTDPTGGRGVIDTGYGVQADTQRGDQR